MQILGEHQMPNLWGRSMPEGPAKWLGWLKPNGWRRVVGTEFREVARTRLSEQKLLLRVC